MTILLEKSKSNKVALADCLDRSIYQYRTYKFKFICSQSKVVQSLVAVPYINKNRFSFVIIEGTNITFDLLGFYEWELIEIEDITLLENTLCKGIMKVADTRTLPTTPTVLDSQTYVVYE